MDFFLSSAWAQAAQPQGGGFELLVMVGIFFLIMYFLLIRPQQKRAREHKALLASLAKGDEVVTSGGILGKVADIGDSFISIEVHNGVQIKVQKRAISTMMPKGTVKSG